MTKARSRRRIRTGPLEVATGWQNEGGVYQLQPWDVDRVHEAFPEAIILPTMLVGYDQTEDYNRFHRRYWP